MLYSRLAFGFVIAATCVLLQCTDGSDDGSPGAGGSSGAGKAGGAAGSTKRGGTSGSGGVSRGGTAGASDAGESATGGSHVSRGGSSTGGGSGGGTGGTGRGGTGGTDSGASGGMSHGGESGAGNGNPGGAGNGSAAEGGAGAGDGGAGATHAGETGAGSGGTSAEGGAGAVTSGGGTGGTDATGGTGGTAGTGGTSAQCSGACTSNLGESCESSCDCCCRQDDQSTWPGCGTGSPQWLSCKSDGLCHPTSCGENGSMFDGGADRCVDDGDCCSPWQCDYAANEGGGAHVKVCCSGEGASCTGGKPCCEGLQCFDDPGPVSRVCGYCKTLHSACIWSRHECCFGMDCDGSTCLLVSGGQCSDPSDCLSGVCDNGTCQ